MRILPILLLIQFTYINCFLPNLIKNTRFTSPLFHSNSIDNINNPHTFSDDFQSEFSDIYEKIYLHSQNVSKLTHVEKTKSIMSLNYNYGHLSTVANYKKLKGYSQNSVVPFTIDHEGNPFLYLSNISKHTKNIKKNNKISFSVTEYGFNNADDARVSLVGKIRLVNDAQQIDNLSKIYLKKHGNVQWLNLSDFNYYIIDDIKEILFNGGLGKADKIKVSQYRDTEPDKVYLLSSDIIDSFNNKYTFLKHNMKKYLKTQVQLQEKKDYDTIYIQNLDKYGINLILKKNKVYFKVTIPFHNQIIQLKQIRNNIMYLFNTYK